MYNLHAPNNNSRYHGNLQVDGEWVGGTAAAHPATVGRDHRPSSARTLWDDRDGNGSNEFPSWNTHPWYVSQAIFQFLPGILFPSVKF